jgi:hypothetical protein
VNDVEKILDLTATRTPTVASRYTGSYIPEDGTLGIGLKTYYFLFP